MWSLAFPLCCLCFLLLMDLVAATGRAGYISDT